MTNKRYLLDTNILIDFVKEVPSVVEKILQVGTHQCCMSVISLHELYYGAQLARENKEEFYFHELEATATACRCVGISGLARCYICSIAFARF